MVSVLFSSVNSSNQTAWRKANLACKLAIDNMEKDELLHGGENQCTRQRFVQFRRSTAVNDDSVCFIFVQALNHSDKFPLC